MSDTTTSRASGTEMYKTLFYENQLLYTAEKQLVFMQLGQRNIKVPAGENAHAIVWTKYGNLSDRSAAESETTATTAEAMSATLVTGTVATYAGAVKLNDILMMEAKDDLKKITYQRLGYQAGLAIDTVVRDVVAPGGTKIFAGTTAAVCAGLWSTVPNTATLSVTQLRKGLRTLLRNNALPVGSSLTPQGEKGQATNRDGLWIAVISADQLYDLQGDTTTGGWITSNQYAGSDKLFTGEVGKMYGTRFIMSGNPYVKGHGTIESTTVSSGETHVTLLAGADFFGVTKLQNLQTFWQDFGSAGTADPTHKVASAAWKTAFGARVLNASFGVSLYTAIGRAYTEA